MIDASEPLPPAVPPLVDPAELRSWATLDDAQLLVFDKPGSRLQPQRCLP